MKRRLPTIREGEFVLAPSSPPPLTADANAHLPSGAQPGNDRRFVLVADFYELAKGAGQPCIKPCGGASSRNRVGRPSGFRCPG